MTRHGSEQRRERARRNRENSDLPAFERTTANGTRPGLHPSLGSGQPALPWAGLLLDGTRPPS